MMKLYATVSSERATKGQGGNTELTITLMGEGGVIVDRLSFKPAIDEGYDLWSAHGDYEPAYLLRHYSERSVQKNTKGKR